MTVGPEPAPPASFNPAESFALLPGPAPMGAAPPP